MLSSDIIDEDAKDLRGIFMENNYKMGGPVISLL
jgi:hypothetical protein